MKTIKETPLSVQKSPFIEKNLHREKLHLKSQIQSLQSTTSLMKIIRNSIYTHQMCILVVMSLVSETSSTLTGLTYMDSLNNKEHDNRPTLENPCNPLYWYPRNIPEYCINKINIDQPHTPPCPPSTTLPLLPHTPPAVDSGLFSMLQPVPVPVPVPSFLPMPPPCPMAPPGIPGQFGMVPGLPGIVSPDGGINIMPFSDAYTDMLEQHKNKVIRKKLKKILNRFNYNY